MYRQRTFCQFFFSSDTRKLTDICAPSQRAPSAHTRWARHGSHASTDRNTSFSCARAATITIP